MVEHSPLLSAISANADALKDKRAIIAGDHSCTYGELRQLIWGTARNLTDKGIGYRSVVLVYAEKGLGFVATYLALQYLGATAVVLDPAINQDKLQYIRDEVQPMLEISDFADLVAIADTPCPIHPQASPSDVAEIMFTTGTTGASKGVLLTHSNIYGSATNINSYIGNTPEDIEVIALPICHSFGLGRLRCNLIKGATAVFADNFANVRALFNILEKSHATGFAMVPTAWAYIRKISGKRISRFANRLKYIEIGSAAMPIADKKELRELLPTTRICMHYGLTEASRSAFVEFHDEVHLTSIGVPVTEDVSISIRDNQWNELPAGEIGNICVKGNMVTPSYLNPEDNVGAFSDGWFNTGDLGYTDNDGYLYLVGREKEMINVGGKKVSPIEVEDAVMSLGVGDCICVAAPDTIMGEVVKCYILRGSTPMTLQEVSEHLEQKLELYKRPRYMEWIDDIPKTESGKKQRSKLR